MDNKSTVPVFFCIPDLTGFTKFMTSTESDFANKVITVLLSKLISANILAMSVAEIEGDAVFFYRKGRLPAVNKVALLKKMIRKTTKSIYLKISWALKSLSITAKLISQR